MTFKFYIRRGQKEQDLGKVMRDEERFVSDIEYVNPLAKPVEPLAFTFDYEEALKRGCFISAMPQLGKSNLAKILVDYLMKQGCVVKVFDNSKVWYRSSVPTYQVIDTTHDEKIYNPLSVSTIFDISRLYPDEFKSFVATVIGDDFHLVSRLPPAFNDKPLPFSIIYLIEEAQLLMPSGSLRASYAQETFRMVSVGANFNLRYIAITQRPADVSVKMISRTGLRYFGGAWEVNDLRKLRAYTGWKFNETLSRFTSLKVGQFWYQKGRETRLIKTPLFKTDVTPVKYERRNWFFRWREVWKRKMDNLRHVLHKDV